MISYIKGELAEILPDVIVVEANGIGYNIYVPGSVHGELPSVGSEVKIYNNAVFPAEGYSWLRYF